MKIQDDHKNGKSRYQSHKIAEAKPRDKLIKGYFSSILEEPKQWWEDLFFNRQEFLLREKMLDLQWKSYESREGHFFFLVIF